VKLSLVKFKQNSNESDLTLELSLDKGIKVLNADEEYQYKIISFQSLDIEHDHLTLDGIELYPRRDTSKEFDVLDIVSKDFAFSVVFIFEEKNKTANKDFMLMIKNRIAEYKSDVPSNEGQVKKKLSSVIDLLSVCHPSYFFYSLEDGHNVFPEAMKEVFSKCIYPCICLDKPRIELPQEEIERLSNLNKQEQPVVELPQEEIPVVETVKENVPASKACAPSREKKQIKIFDSVKNVCRFSVAFVKAHWDSFLFYLLQCVLFSSLLLLGSHLVGKSDVNIAAPIIFIFIGVVCYILSIVIEADLFVIVKKQNKKSDIVTSISLLGVVALISFGIGYAIFYLLMTNNLLVKTSMFNPLFILIPAILTVVLLCLFPFYKQVAKIFEDISKWLKTKFKKK